MIQHLWWHCMQSSCSKENLIATKPTVKPEVHNFYLKELLKPTEWIGVCFLLCFVLLFSFFFNFRKILIIYCLV